MSKKNENESVQQEVKVPGFVDELIGAGTVTIKAKTREELNEMLAAIPSDVSYAAGAVGEDKETRLLSLRLDILK
jgi:hypothetical protein